MNTLAERLISSRERKQLTQKDLAKLAGVSQSTIGNLEAGTRRTARRIVEIAAALDVNATWLATGKGPAPGLVGVDSEEPTPQSDEWPFIDAAPGVHGRGVRVGSEPSTVPIRAVKLRLQAGVSGFVAEPDLDVDHGYFQVPRHVIEELRANPEDLIVMSVKGRSMEPMMFEDDKVLVDTSKRTPINNECFAVNWNGEPIIKCLIKRSDSWALYSMNRDPKYHTIDVRSGQCSIIGLVVWQPARIITGRI